MDIRSLACFVAVAEDLHFRRAAERLHITQSALSQRIRALEDELGAPLLERDRRHVALTPAGVAFLEPARVAIAQAGLARTQALRAMRGEVGHLRLGFTVIAFYGHLPEAVRSYRNRFPDVRIELVEMNSPGLERSLELGEIDLAILHPPVGSSRLSLRMMPSQKMVLALPADHHLSRRRTISVRDLADEPFLIAPRTVGPSIYDRVIALFQQQGISPNIVQHVTPMTTLIGLVAAGVGVGLVTEGLARTGRPGVTFRDVSPTPPDLPMAAAWFGSSPSPTAQRFLELVTEMFTTRQDGVEGNLSGDGCD